MKRLIEYSAANYIAVLIFIVLLTAVTGWFMPQLQIDVSSEGLMIADTPERAYYESILREYGSDNIMVVVIKDDDIQSVNSLARVKRIVDRISALEFVRRTDSLFSVKNIRVENDNIISTPYLNPLPASDEKSSEIFARAKTNPFVSRNLLSDDGKTMAINIHLDDINLGDQQDAYITRSIENILQYYEADFEEIYQFGLPYVRSVVEKQIVDEQVVLVPQSFLVLIIVLLFVLRNLNAGLLPLVTSLTSIVWLLGLMAMIDIPLTLVTAIIPILLIIIGSTEDVHLISEYLLAKKAGKSRNEAVKIMARRKGFASLMTFLTSWFGFASVAINPLEVLREFSIVATSGLLFNYLVTMMLVPAWLCVFGSKKSRSLETGKALRLLNPLLNSICFIVHERKGKTLAVIGVITVVFLYGAFQIKLNNNIMSYFEESSPIKIRAHDVAHKLAGVESFMIVLDAGIEDTYLHSRYLQQMHDLARYIESQEYIEKALSFADYLTVMNSAVNETGKIQLPRDDYVVQELSLFIDHDDVKQYIDPDYSKAIIHVRHHIDSSHVFKRTMNNINEFINENIDKSIDVTVTGESVLINDAADSLAFAQAASLLLILFIIFVVVSLIFVNIHAGLLSILPNIFPVIIMFGIMGWFDIPLDTGTAMIAVIAIGVIIDNTMHFMVRYNQELNDIYDEESAIVRTIRAEALPIISASLALALGFVVMTQSGFMPIVYFGALSAVVIMVALVAEFTLTPILLSSVRLVTLWDMLSLHLKDQLLKNCRLFDGMRPWQVRKLILLSRLQHYKKGDHIMQEGEPASEMYILLDGAADITIAEQGGVRVIKESPEHGRLFGMMRVSDEGFRGTSAIATKDSDVLVISWQSIERVARFYPRISSLFFQNLSKILGNRLLEEFQTAKVEPDKA
jgi:predicted RND superfamily exporter protein